MSRLDDVPQDVDCNCPGFCTGAHTRVKGPWEQLDDALRQRDALLKEIKRMADDGDSISWILYEPEPIKALMEYNEKQND